MYINYRSTEQFFFNIEISNIHKGWKTLITYNNSYIIYNLDSLCNMVLSLSTVHSLEKEMATDFIILAWKMPRTEELGRLQFTGHKESDVTQHIPTHGTLTDISSLDVCSNCIR